MFKKIKKKLESGKIKRQAKFLKEMMSEKNLELTVRDRYGVSYDIKSHYNLRHFLHHNTYFDGNIAELLSELKKKGRYKMALDVGANKGMTAAFLASFVDCVYAFEPEEHNITSFKRTMALNEVKNVELIPNAVSNQEGTVKFFIAPGESHHSLGTAHLGQTEDNVRNVPCVTLDSFCKQRGIGIVDILKVDVEGFETSVFEGASQMLSDKKIKNILFEVSLGVMDRLKLDPAGPLQVLENYGYKITNVYGFAVQSQDILKYGGQDMLAVPK